MRHLDISVFIVNQEGRALLRNDSGGGGNWLEVGVKCVKSNRTGFGANAEIEAGGVKQSQDIGGQTSYLSQNFQEAHFGLNHEREVTHLKVTFPSGLVREMEHDVPRFANLKDWFGTYLAEELTPREN